MWLKLRQLRVRVMTRVRVRHCEDMRMYVDVCMYTY